VNLRFHKTISPTRLEKTRRLQTNRRGGQRVERAGAVWAAPSGLQLGEKTAAFLTS
jgi:hypothetical protein